MTLLELIVWLIETICGIVLIMTGSNLTTWNDCARTGIGVLFLIAAAINLIVAELDID